MKNPETFLKRRLLTAKDAATYLGLSEATVRQWASQGRLPKVKLGGNALRFDKVALDEMIRADSIPAKNI